MPYTADQLLQMTSQQLDDLFRQSPPGAIPNGEAKGTAIIAPGTEISPVLANIIEIFAWQGKTFNATTDTLVNQITFFGISAIEAKIYVGPSLFDGSDCIILDYSANPGIVGQVRDEIRVISSSDPEIVTSEFPQLAEDLNEVGPELYLGLVWVDRKRTIYFSLEFDQSNE